MGDQAQACLALSVVYRRGFYPAASLSLVDVYVGEKWHSWSDVTPTDDFLCATLTLYWITQSITSSMRDYWDNRWHPLDPTYVSTPTAFGVFAHQTVPEGELPRSYLERLYNIQRWTVFPRGGHFAPAEEPAAVAGDLTAFFRGLS